MKANAAVMRANTAANDAEKSAKVKADEEKKKLQNGGGSGGGGSAIVFTNLKDIKKMFAIDTYDVELTADDLILKDGTDVQKRIVNTAGKLISRKLKPLGIGPLSMIVESDGVKFVKNGLRMFSVTKKADNGDLAGLNDFLNTMDDKTYDAFTELGAIGDVLSLYNNGHTEKYEALQDAGLVGEDDQVMGGFFVVDEEKMGGANKGSYARRAAGTTIRLMLGMLSCTVGNGAVKGAEKTTSDAQLNAVVSDLKTRVGAVKDMDVDTTKKIAGMIDEVKKHVEKPNFSDVTLFDHVNTNTTGDKGKAIEQGGDGASGSTPPPSGFIYHRIDPLGITNDNAALFLRAFNAITSFLMTAQNDGDRGERDGRLNMLTTAADIVWQFQKVRRMVQVEALKQSNNEDMTDEDKSVLKAMNSADHMEDKMPIGANGSDHPVGSGGGFMNRMFEMYVINNSN